MGSGDPSAKGGSLDLLKPLPTNYNLTKSVLSDTAKGWLEQPILLTSQPLLLAVGLTGGAVFPVRKSSVEMGQLTWKPGKLASTPILIGLALDSLGANGTVNLVAVLGASVGAGGKKVEIRAVSSNESIFPSASGVASAGQATLALNTNGQKIGVAKIGAYDAAWTWFSRLAGSAVWVPTGATTTFRVYVTPRKPGGPWVDPAGKNADALEVVRADILELAVGIPLDSLDAPGVVTSVAKFLRGGVSNPLNLRYKSLLDIGNGANVLGPFSETMPLGGGGAWALLAIGYVLAGLKPLPPISGAFVDAIVHQWVLPSKPVDVGSIDCAVILAVIAGALGSPVSLKVLCVPQLAADSKEGYPVTPFPIEPVVPIGKSKWWFGSTGSSDVDLVTYETDSPAAAQSLGFPAVNLMPFHAVVELAGLAWDITFAFNANTLPGNPNQPSTLNFAKQMLFAVPLDTPPNVLNIKNTLVKGGAKLFDQKIAPLAVLNGA